MKTVAHAAKSPETPSKFYAHSGSCQDRSDWQLLSEHQYETASLASSFAQHFTSSDWTWTAALLHDLGKIDPRFQKKLHEANGLEYEDEALSGSVNHSGAGAAYAEEKYGPIFGRTLAYLILGHHAGLPDYQTDQTGNAAFVARMPEAKENLAEIEEAIAPFVADMKESLQLPEFVKKQKGHNYHLWVRMLFSCLVDADWLDTERVMSPEKYGKRSKIEFPSIDELTQKIREHMNSFSGTTGRFNEIRREILEACRMAAQQEPGLFTLTVPTGGGKTLSSMAFALEHAKKYKKDRIIYVIPYTSIIEQTADVFGKVFGKNNVVEHHSNVSDDDNDRIELDMAADNWDAPIIVTTNVQFFESLYASKPKRCRKLHNIANSVVIIDEAQLISPEHLTPCVDVINELTRSFGVSMVLCTATQPALDTLNKKKIGVQLDTAREIIPDPNQYYESLKRVEYHFPENINEPTTWEKLAEELKQHDEVLCVVNTRRDCRELYDLMKDQPGMIHLSALMCGEHRSEVIKDIKKRLEENRELKKASHRSRCVSSVRNWWKRVSI